MKITAFHTFLLGPGRQVQKTTSKKPYFQYFSGIKRNITKKSLQKQWHSLHYFEHFFWIYTYFLLLGQLGTVIQQLQDNLELHNWALPSRMRAGLNRKRLLIGFGRRPACMPCIQAGEDGLRELGQMVEQYRGGLVGPLGGNYAPPPLRKVV